MARPHPASLAATHVDPKQHIDLYYNSVGAGIEWHKRLASLARSKCEEMLELLNLLHCILFESNDMAIEVYGMGRHSSTIWQSVIRSMMYDIIDELSLHARYFQRRIDHCAMFAKANRETSTSPNWCQLYGNCLSVFCSSLKMIEGILDMTKIKGPVVTVSFYAIFAERDQTNMWLYNCRQALNGIVEIANEVPEEGEFLSIKQQVKQVAKRLGFHSFDEPHLE